MKRQAVLLDLSRGSVYYEPVGTSGGDLALMAAMDDIHILSVHETGATPVARCKEALDAAP